VQLSNATYGVITKVALHGKGGVNPLVFSLFRDALSFPLLEAIALAVDGALLPARGDVGRFFCLGVFGMFGNQFCYILGLVYIDAGLASVINLLTPVCVWCFATSIGLDRFSWPQAAGVVCAVGGAMIFVGLLELGDAAAPGAHDDGSSSGGGLVPDSSSSSSSMADKLKGSLAVFGSCVTMSVYYILMKPVLKIYPPITITAWSYFFGALVMGLVSLMYVPWTGDWKDHPDPFKLCSPELELADGCPTVGDAWIVTQKAWAAIFVAVVVNSVMKYGLTSFANKHVSVT
jgi:drug/metabolite transporter (DMT)-like permease